MSEYQRRVIAEVINERQRQDDKWGVQNHDDLTWLAILSEEVGEAAQAMLKTGEANPEVWMNADIRVGEELIQVAAVAVAWMECRARRESD